MRPKGPRPATKEGRAPDADPTACAASGAEAMAVRREPFPITVDVEAAAAKKRVAGVFEARKAEEERKQQEQAKLMGVRTDLAPRTVHSHCAS